nr:succinylglutamate desuccinylase/aspartoacylase family protein [Mesorhizobium loti]
MQQEFTMPRSIETVTLPVVLQGTVRSLQVFRYGKAGAGPKIYIQGALHAGEMPGPLVIHHLTRLLDEADANGEIHGEVVLVPLANPIGFAQDLSGTHYGRFDQASRENYNRGFPWIGAEVAARIGDQLTTDARFNVQLVRKTARKILDQATARTEFDHLRLALMRMAIDADYCFDLHCAGEAPLYIYCDDDPGEGRVAEFAAQLGSEATFIHAYMEEGRPFSSAVGQLWLQVARAVGDSGKPLVQPGLSGTVELRGSRDVDDATNAADAANLLRYMMRRGIVAGDPGPLPEAKAEPQPITACDHGYAPRTGILAYTVPVGAQLRRGDEVCCIVDPSIADFAAARFPVLAGCDGILFDRAGDRLARAGEQIFRIAANEPLPHRFGKTALDD